ncbi:hypothetical protein BLS_006102 [Venturia inaequalis]|uniref:CENP-C homolog n=1 Tax=Venturia inaequalis TaxID=5025 RepID=A0A8H3UE40_VENIN|nr:hypothetical protein BLS_006102 [Venturia inaequalis]
MAPANSPGRKKRDRDNQFFEVGVQGRKTGITLPVGQKDEHGIEDLDGIFSSPEKESPRRQNGNTTLSSSSMDLAQSSVPEPTEVLSTRRILKSSKTTFPPPLGRSPYKTNIDRDDRASSHPAVSRRLDFSVDDTSVAQSPLRQPARRGNGRPRKDLYRLTVSPSSPEVRNQEQDILEEEEEDTTVPEETIEPTMDTEEATEMPTNGNYENEEPMFDDSMQLLNDEIEEPEQLPLSSPSVLRKSRYHAAEAETTLDQAEGGEDTSINSDPRRRPRTRNSLANSDSVSSPAVVARKAPAKNAPLQKAAPAPGRGRKGKSNLLMSALAPHLEDSVASSPELPEEIEEPTVLEESQDDTPIEEPVVAKKRGRPAKAAPIEASDESIVETAPPPKKRGRAPKPPVETHAESPAEPAKTKKRGRPARTPDQSIIEAAVPAADESTVEPAPKKKRGRPARIEEEPSRPAKKAKTSAQSSAATGSKLGPPAPKKKPIARSAPDSPPKRSVRAPSVASTAFAGARSHTVLREATPFEEEATRKTRSGRSVIAPVRNWLGEKIEYERDGTKKVLKKAEQVDVPRIERTRTVSAAPRKKRKAAASMDVIEEEEEQTLEDWEERQETIRIFVQQWDPVNATAADSEEEQAIAYGVHSLPIEMVGGGAKFAFTKTHSSHFFGTGIMEIPPGGYKMKKNSRKMTMAFFMHTGKVDVVVADDEFTISKGGIFHVPRGNTYSIHNPREHMARIFFAQGCQIAPDVEG